jgi:hypothetical protein
MAEPALSTEDVTASPLLPDNTALPASYKTPDETRLLAPASVAASVVSREAVAERVLDAASVAVPASRSTARRDRVLDPARVALPCQTFVAAGCAARRINRNGVCGVGDGGINHRIKSK